MKKTTIKKIFATIVLIAEYLEFYYCTKMIDKALIPTVYAYVSLLTLFVAIYIWGEIIDNKY